MKRKYYNTETGRTRDEQTSSDDEVVAYGRKKEEVVGRWAS